ncbi:host specificity factor TipJ family phage tail protein [Pigmentiphaga kullae]|uniref:Tail protein n=1 Tax=Pigmentiphaga kullae TaxID=151784 RepID=A0A4Q7NCP6_9BURK|nr:host specificity factor TipJ family phage tail protein [Pigmentiphaga kullae]RZS80660.1 hypothetical protein EV675_3272 [Pigmentiphaga kullae]
MPLVSIERHALEGLSRTEHETDDVLALLYREFDGRLPPLTRIYNGPVSRETEVTPVEPADVERLAQLEGPLTVEVWPTAGIQAWQVVLFIVSLAVSSILAPTVPAVAQRNVQSESPNNGLSERTNTARVMGRIPDIFGTVRSTPDLIQVPYKVFTDHVEMEVSLMCIGRGTYEIPAAQVRDDTTPIQEIAGSSVEIYGPFTSPNSGHAPQLRIGNAISLPVLKTARLNAVNGQVLQPSDSGRLHANEVIFQYPNVIASQDLEVDYTTSFVVGDSLVVTNAARSAGTFTHSGTAQALYLSGSSLDANGELTYPGDLTADWSIGDRVTISGSLMYWTWDDEATGQHSGYANLDGVYEVANVEYETLTDSTIITFDKPARVNINWYQITAAAGGGAGPATISRNDGTILFDLTGTYVITAITANNITLQTPSVVNPDWEILNDDFGGVSGVMRPDLYTSGDRRVGEFTLSASEPIRRLISNFVAYQGLFADDGSNQYRRDVDVRLVATPVDAAGVAVGPEEVFDGTVIGSSTTRSTRALTVDVTLSATSNYWKVYARRLNPKDTGFSGQVVDEIKWRDLYQATPVDMLHFGDVTIAQTKTMATDGALAVKDRKLNMLVTRCLPARVSGSTFTPELYPTNDVATILSAVCLDPRIGNRTPEEVDFDNLFDTAAEIRDYFGFPEAADFSYTFDADNLSFQEAVTSIAGAVFCQPYRRGSVLRLFFERATDDSVLLFNHRNKLPGSEKRTDRFGWAEAANDGIEFQYVDPEDDAVVTLYRPADRSAINPKRIESIGVRNRKQATLLADRAYNKLRYQTTTSQATCLPEADLLVLRERVLWADNTRSGAMDGYVKGVQGLELHLSQELAWESGATYTMFLQGKDRLVESIPISRGQSDRHAVLAHAPHVPVVADADRYLSTGFIVVRDGDDSNAQPMLLEERDAPGDDGTIPLTVINYDSRYYQNDGAFRESA